MALSPSHHTYSENIPAQSQRLIMHFSTLILSVKKVMTHRACIRKCIQNNAQAV